MQLLNKICFIFVSIASCLHGYAAGTNRELPQVNFADPVLGNVVTSCVTNLVRLRDDLEPNESSDSAPRDVLYLEKYGQLLRLLDNDIYLKWYDRPIDPVGYMIIDGKLVLIDRNISDAVITNSDETINFYIPSNQYRLSSLNEINGYTYFYIPDNHESKNISDERACDWSGMLMDIYNDYYKNDSKDEETFPVIYTSSAYTIPNVYVTDKETLAAINTVLSCELIDDVITRGLMHPQIYMSRLGNRIVLDIDFYLFSDERHEPIGYCKFDKYLIVFDSSCREILALTGDGTATFEWATIDVCKEDIILGLVIVRY